MKLVFAIFFALQMLLNSILAFAHMAQEVYDPHEAVHVHAGTDHEHDAIGDESDHDSDAHFHLCAFALSSGFAPTDIALDSPAISISPQQVNSGTSPPVPPPNA